MNEQPGRMYSEREVLAVLKRAAELQDQVGLQVSRLSGSNQEELFRLGAEVGIDAKFVQAALDELASTGIPEDHKVQTRLLGAPPEYAVERTIPGILTQEQWETMVGILNSEYRQSIPGIASGQFRTWKWKHEFGYVHFSAQQIGPNVRLKLHLHIDDGIVAGIIPTAIMWFVVTTAAFTSDALRPWLSMLISALTLVAFTVGFQKYTAAWLRKDRQQSMKLLEQFVEVMSSTTSLPSASTVPSDESMQTFVNS